MMALPIYYCLNDNQKTNCLEKQQLCWWVMQTGLDRMSDSGYIMWWACLSGQQLSKSELQKNLLPNSFIICRVSGDFSHVCFDGPSHVEEHPVYCSRGINRGRRDRKLMRARKDIMEFTVSLYLLITWKTTSIKFYWHDGTNMSWTRIATIHMPKWTWKSPQVLNPKVLHATETKKCWEWEEGFFPRKITPIGYLIPNVKPCTHTCN